MKHCFVEILVFMDGETRGGGDEQRWLFSGVAIRSLQKMGKDSESSNHFALAGKREQLFITHIAGAWNLAPYKISVLKELLRHLPSHLKQTLFKSVNMQDTGIVCWVSGVFLLYCIQWLEHPLLLVSVLFFHRLVHWCVTAVLWSNLAVSHPLSYPTDYCHYS